MILLAPSAIVCSGADASSEMAGSPLCFVFASTLDFFIFLYSFYFSFVYNSFLGLFFPLYFTLYRLIFYLYGCSVCKSTICSVNLHSFADFFFFSVPVSRACLHISSLVLFFVYLTRPPLSPVPFDSSCHICVVA